MPGEEGEGWTAFTAGRDAWRSGLSGDSDGAGMAVCIEAHATMSAQRHVMDVGVSEGDIITGV